MTDLIPNSKKNNKTGHDQEAEIPRQLIIFGPPGTGKTFRVHGKSKNREGKFLYDPDSYATKLGIPEDAENRIVNAVFHPEYTYGDFMGRLQPLSQPDGKITYRFRPGHFLIALAEAYNTTSYQDDSDDHGNVLLVIDELNRGNASAIFGPVFNLLDRDDEGRSSYPITLPEMEFNCLLYLIEGITNVLPSGKFFQKEGTEVTFPWSQYPKLRKLGLTAGEGNDEVATYKITLPPNLYVMATINTSDESIYYMDSAFKRRWDWEYMHEDGKIKSPNIDGLTHELDWSNFRQKLNSFIRSDGATGRKLDDKVLGNRFIKGIDENGTKTMNARDVSKVFFHLWDSVFARDRRPLEEFIGSDVRLRTFSDFIERADGFIKKVDARPVSEKKNDD